MAALFVNSAASSASDSWKAQAFLNLFIKKPDGSKLKVGAIPLKTSKKTDAKLIERLQQEGAVDEMLKVLELDFQMVDTSAAVDIGF